MVKKAKIFFMNLKTSDRMHPLYVSTPGMTGTDCTSNLGVYRTADDGGAVVDIDGFCPATVVPMDDLQDAIARVDCLLLNGTTQIEDSGKPLGDIINQAMGGSAYTEDPLETWVVVITILVEDAITAAGEIVVEAYYTATGN